MNDKESLENTSLDDFIGGKISLFQPLKIKIQNIS